MNLTHHFYYLRGETMLKTWWYGRTKPAQESSLVWIDQLVVLSLHAINRGVQVAWCIDRSEAIEDYFQSDIRLHAVLSPSLIEFIVHAVPADRERLLWVRLGLLIGVTEQDGSYNYTQWVERYTSIVVQVFPQSRTFTVMIPGRTWHSIGSYHMVNLLKELFSVS